MVYMYIRQRVENYSAWRAAFDSMAVARKDAGATGVEQIWCNPEDPQDLTLVLEWQEMDALMSYGRSPELRSAMQKAGVYSMPDIRYLVSAP